MSSTDRCSNCGRDLPNHAAFCSFRDTNLVSKWTEEPPSEEGFYFWRLTSGLSCEPVRVKNDPEYGRIASVMNEPYDVSIDEMEGQWWPVKIEVPE